MFVPIESIVGVLVSYATVVVSWWICSDFDFDKKIGLWGESVESIFEQGF